ncbi:DUF1269 domain-containing protein [Propioniciclava coleopterorum]|uniref:DUF1269 domain-containing protein n=1 Tax=Propioniciclava coleopterorum TaxID=2714937 RepID=A0A6G7Y6N3_9ACTN|nr:DUF1269 domain-containing protein [Propioniciclava coleopterorum]QIK72554.1 DUF1269 domain-containing protein [Propioniciclava coleopterorum]
MTSYVAVLTFPNSADVYQAYSDLKSSPVIGEVGSAVILQRDADGALTVPQDFDPGAGAGVATGSLVGLLVGILGGPLGMLLGWGAGAAIGALTDADRADDADSALSVLARSVPAGRNALVLQTEETDESALDHFAADRGATIVRQPLDEVLAEAEAEQDAAEVAREAASEKLRSERKAGRKEKIEDRIAALRAKLEQL